MGNYYQPVSTTDICSPDIRALRHYIMPIDQQILLYCSIFWGMTPMEQTELHYSQCVLTVIFMQAGRYFKPSNPILLYR